MSTTDETPDEPKYVEIDDVPLGPAGASIDPDRKRAAILSAESKMESDCNDGAPIEDPTQDHRSAVVAWASYLLYLPATDPSSARYGDIAEYGASALEYVREFKSLYWEYINSINDSSPDETEGGDDTTPGEGVYQPEPQFETY